MSPVKWKIRQDEYSLHKILTSWLLSNIIQSLENDKEIIIIIIIIITVIIIIIIMKIIKKIFK